ncbi:ScyD/ScyE family protein [Pleomorphovibrio marinus]|uniref:ScyD/ScyE family protein n=1 Tax=Pleomorphovibrio marinus TaxID=2164132 RepID=UPI000E0A73E1|nr:ScyD/ScyE family protein [Pleomorphovibrio marinus]
MKNLSHYLPGLIFILISGCLDNPAPVRTVINNPEFVTGLNAPIGMVLDNKQNLWVTESGTGNNDSQLTLITPAGKKHVVANGFPSMIRVQENIPVGLHHLIIKDNKVIMIHSSGDGDGSLYTLDISHYKIGDPPVNASSLEKKDISTFIKNEIQAEYSNPYDIVSGPNEEIYIVDAGANAIIKIDKSGKQSLVAEIEGIQNPAEVGPGKLESVPTGIIWDGEKFLITTLNGFPFPQGYARVLQMDVDGNVKNYKGGYNSLTGITLSPSKRLVVIEYARFVPPPQSQPGWQANTGRLLIGDGDPIVLMDGLNTPTAVVSSVGGFYYVNSFHDGKILRIKTIGT